MGEPGHGGQRDERGGATGEEQAPPPRARPGPALARERLPELLAALPAVGGMLLQRAHDGGRERSRRLGTRALDRDGPLGDVLGDDHAVGALKGRRARQHLVGHDAERVEIAPAVDLLAGRLLGAHVRGRPDGDALPRAAGAALARHGPRDAEIGQHRAAGGLVEQHVLGLHVAVDHAGAPRRFERRGQVRHDAMDGPRIEPRLAHEPLAETLALDLVHDVVEQSIRVTRGVDGDDVGVTQPGDGAGLGQEAPADRLVRGELGVHRLDGDAAVERGVGGEKDDAHPPAPQLALEPVLRLQHGLERGEKVEGRSRHGPIRRKGSRNRKYTPAADGAHGSTRPHLDALPTERVAHCAFRGCFGLNPC